MTETSFAHRHFSTRTGLDSKTAMATKAATAVLATLVVLGTLAVAAPASAQVQETYNYTASLFAGVAGSTDADPGDGVDNGALQLGLNFVTKPRTQIALRLGRFDLDSEELFGGLRDAELTYITVAGQYRLSEGYYDSALFAGLGLYDLDGTPVLGDSDSETSAGLQLGVLGDFAINRRFSFLLELSGHYVDFDDANVFVMGMAGVGFHFR